MCVCVCVYISTVTWYDKTAYSAWGFSTLWILTREIAIVKRCYFFTKCKARSGGRQSTWKWWTELWNRWRHVDLPIEILGLVQPELPDDHPAFVGCIQRSVPKFHHSLVGYNPAHPNQLINADYSVGLVSEFHPRSICQSLPCTPLIRLIISSS